MFCRACGTVQAKREGILWPLANTKSFKNMSNYSEINLGIIAHKGGGGLELRHCQQKPRSKKEQDSESIQDCKLLSQDHLKIF